MQWAQPETATYKVLNPRWQQTVETELLRSIDLSTRLNLWIKTKDGQQKRNQPKPFEWPWEVDARRDRNTPRPDALSWEEAEAIFGLTARMEREQRERERQVPDDQHEAYPPVPDDRHQAFPDDEE